MNHTGRRGPRAPVLDTPAACHPPFGASRSSGRKAALAAQPEGTPSTPASSFATRMLPVKDPATKAPATMAEQSSGVGPSPPVPLWCHFDVMGALFFVMRRSCRIRGPVIALSAGLLGLTEPVMELGLNKRVITSLCSTVQLIHMGGLPSFEHGGGEHHQKQHGWKGKPSDYLTNLRRLPAKDPPHTRS